MGEADHPAPTTADLVAHFRAIGEAGLAGLAALNVDGSEPPASVPEVRVHVV